MQEQLISTQKETATNDYSPYLGEIIISEERQPVIVFIFGKVGSKTVVESIHRLGNIPYSVYHVQTMAPKTLENARNYVKDTGHSSVNKVLNFNGELSAFIHDNFEKFKWKVITLTRDPGAIALSSFFQFLDIGILKASLPELYEGDKISATFDTFKKQFENNFLRSHINYLELWFDIEMKEVFKIDVFAEPFDHDKGYKIIQGDHADLLIIRNEDLNNVFSKAVKEFLGLENVGIVNDNRAHEKYYGNLYRFVKDNLQLSKDTAEFLYSTKYAKHFYSKKELKKFRSKWTEKKKLKDKLFIDNRINPMNIFDRLDTYRKREIPYKAE